MKKKKFLTYLLSGLIPCLIFFVCACILGFVPVGKNILNIYDSFTQYPGMLIEYSNLLKTGNIFYSWNAGLGFNFFGTLTYYAASPLNLVSIFASQTNYPFLIAMMTYLRFILLGLSMCFYLDHKDTKPLYTVFLSTAFALMGYTSAYYYNYLWIDSIIMLPLIIHGLDKLIEENKPTFYIVTLTFTIFINYYIGYMICIFCLIYFLYRLINQKDKKKIIKTFIISSLLAGLMSTVIILPSYFALKTGKASLYNSTSYGGVSRNLMTFFYTFMTGEYQVTDQSYGPAQVYSSLLVLVLTFFYFFNTKYSKKEKIATALVIIFFYLSFSVNALNYAWQFFQRPIWWSSRFSFTFSFFLIVLARDTLMNIEKTDFKIKYRIILSVLFILAVVVGAYFKWQVINKVDVHTYIYLALGFLIFLEAMFLADKKYFLPFIIGFAFLDISINTFNNLKCNQRYQSYVNYAYLKEDLPPLIEELKDENDNFFRFELMDDYTSDDGLYFNYHGISYFNSVRNVKVVDFVEKLGLKVADKCHIFLNRFDPATLSLLNVKYLYGKMDYFKMVKDRIYENPYPLGIGFGTNKKVKNTDLYSDDYRVNVANLINDLTGQNYKIYHKIDNTNFELKNLKIEYGKLMFATSDVKNSTARYTFKSDGNYLLMTADLNPTIYVNGEEVENRDYYVEINKDDLIDITYSIKKETPLNDLFLYLFDIKEYERAMEELSKDVMRAETYKNGHILEGTVEITNGNNYLFTSIEHEEGMRVFVDGKEVKYDVILDALIGFEITEGKHTVFVDYTPKGLKTGAIVSGVSLLLTCFYLQIRKKKL